MPKRENTIDSSGSTTDFVRNNNNITAAEEAEEDVPNNNNINSTISFNHDTSSEQLLHNKRIRLEQQQEHHHHHQTTPSSKYPTSSNNPNLLLLTRPSQATTHRVVSTMSVAAVAVPTATNNSNGNNNNNSTDSPSYSSSSSSSNGDKLAASTSNGQMSPPSMMTQTNGDANAAVDDDDEEATTNAIVDLITDNANYKVMDGVQVSKTNLIVNYVPQQMSQDDLQKLFERFGTLDSCKLVRDKTTNLSLGYAFVNFQRAEDAEKAIKNANGMRIQNKSLKVSYARPSTEDIKGANLYVSGIPKTWTENELKQYFYGHGQIITGRILVDNKSGLSKGVGFIRFDTREEANSAIQALNNTTPEGGTEAVTVKFANNPTHSPNSNTNTNNNNTNNNRQQFQNNLLAMSAAALLNQQQQQQQQRRVSAVNLNNNNTSALLSPMGGGGGGLNPLAAAAAAMASRLRGNFPVNMQTNGGGFDAELLASTLLSAGANPAIAAALLSSAGLTSSSSINGGNQYGLSHANGGFAVPAGGISGQVVNNNNNNVGGAANNNGASSNGGAGSGYCLFVYNLPPDAEESLLWQLFGPFGAVQSVKIVRDNITQRCKGFGFITMMNYADALNAMQNLDGYSLAGRPLQVKPRTQRGGSGGGSVGGVMM